MRTLQSPVLIGREEFLALADRRLAAAAEGRGHLLLVAGEAGIGKTRLLAAVAAAARGWSFGVVRAAAFPGDSEASGGLLLDLASDLRHATGERPAALGRAISARLREPGGVGGDRHRRRRLLVQDLADTVAAVHDRSDGIPCTSRSCWPPCRRRPPGPTPPGWRPPRTPAGWRPCPCPTPWPTPCWPGPGGWTSPRWRWPGRAR